MRSLQQTLCDCSSPTKRVVGFVGGAIACLGLRPKLSVFFALVVARLSSLRCASLAFF